MKQTAVYVTLIALVTGGYLLVRLGFGALPGARSLGTSPVTTIAFAVLVALAFEPLRRRIEATSSRRQPEDAGTVREAPPAPSPGPLEDAQAQRLHGEKLASLGQLVAGVAHEINTPVTAIVGNVKPLRNELARLRDRAALHGDPTLEQIAARIQAIFEVMARGAERTASIVQDLRVFSRVGEARPLPMDLHEALDVSLRLLRPRWADRISVHRDYGALPAVEAAAGPINQVLMNLLANACDAIQGRGNIWVRTRGADGMVTIAVRDDGDGIAAEHLGRIFEPFFTTKPPGRGTGLGLAISANIVRDHGGTIAVDSAPGRGATFTVTLPVHAAPQAEGAS